MSVNINERYIIESYDDNMIIIEFTESQDILPEEEHLGMLAYECYILDNDYEAETRAIYYSDEDNDIQYLKYREDPREPKLTTIRIHKICQLLINPEMSVERFYL